MKLIIKKPTEAEMPTGDTGQPILQPSIIKKVAKEIHFNAAKSRFTKKTTTRKERKQQRKQRGKGRKK